ncbi:Ribosomal RNA large subunit methyltransferase K [Rubripirellula lacrimiformis]|uniref:Ribosomal RNA large subunit methyltransferase K n=1 Tax=Rubripirellula lacrimiformis TaxID=1930273 RepID=A0A517N5R2_9BACT|nr:class I SAM-dependent methyltransferase [Rubripirellula lacrimiformis]QDT02482.1 Ribosomal RNA large subunit methyltransferase K [Rubripirellula lacrimiformis]
MNDAIVRQTTDFAARLTKRARHFRKWPTKRGITCFRLYERDIPEIPLVVDRYEDCLHITEYERPHDRSDEDHESWLDLMATTAGATLDVPPEKVFFKRRSRQRGKTQHEKVDQSEHRMEVNEGGLKFLVNLRDYVDTGLFLDHRETRAMVREQAKGKVFLNLFCYTGAFTVYAAAGGATRTVSVDLSKTYLEWSRQNLNRNGLSGDQHEFVAADCRQFVKDHWPGATYDLIVCDPPTFSNSKRTDQDWNVQDDSVQLITELMRLMRSGGVLFFSNNFRQFKFDGAAIEKANPGVQIHEISNQTIPEDFRNRRIHRCWRIAKPK